MEIAIVFLSILSAYLLLCIVYILATCWMFIDYSLGVANPVNEIDVTTKDTIQEWNWCEFVEDHSEG